MDLPISNLPMRRQGVIVLLMLFAAVAVTAHDQPPPGPVPPAPASISDLPCVGGMAGIFPCENVDLLAYVSIADFGSTSANDIWGWTDPQTGVEYALIGLRDGLGFVDLADPKIPVYLGKLPTHTSSILWRDAKVHADHVYIVSEATGHGMQVFDLTQLAGVTSPPVTFTATAHYPGFGDAHNIAINEGTGFAYVVGTNTCSGGLHMVDLLSPAAPVAAGCFSADGYTHDTQCVTYHGPDAAYQGREICLSSNTDTLTIVDVTDKQAPVQISRTGYTGVGYAHQGWLTDDHAWFIADDELDEMQQEIMTRTFVWDVSDLDAPFVAGVHDATTYAIDHNQYVVGDHVFQANYRAGLRVLRTGDLANAELGEVAYFDTFPGDDAADFSGVWSVYPYFESGVVVLSDVYWGLFVVRPDLDAVTRCNDGLDNDADGLVDYGGDPGCANRLSFASEDPQCSDGADNDLDGDIDHPADAQCHAASDDDEATNPSACGLGFEVVVALGVMGALRRRRLR